MVEAVLIVLIVLSFAGMLIYFLQKKTQPRSQNNIFGKHIFVTNGVNIKTLLYGREKGDGFPTDQLEKGTVVISENALPLCTLIAANPMTGKEYKKSFRTEVYIGRAVTADCKDNKIIIEGDNSISKTHCRIRYLNNQLLLDDLNTPNHTYLNGERVIGTAVITQNDELKIGNTRLIIRYTGKGA